MHPLADRIENTIYKPDALAHEVHRVAADAIQYKMRAVCVTPVWVPPIAKMLRGSGVRTSSAIAYPSGTSKSTIKAIEATSTIKDGAEEIEVTPFLPHILNFDVDSARAELMEIVRAARSTRPDVFVKVICDLSAVAGQERTERAIETACRATRESGCDAVGMPGIPDLIDTFRKYSEGLELKYRLNRRTQDPTQITDLLDHLQNLDRIGIENAGAILSGSVT